MSTEKQKLNQVDQRSQYVVFGYIRNIQQLLESYHSAINKTNITFYNIPKGIIYQCLFFYYTMEYFAIIGKHIKCTEEQTTITVSNSINCSCFGKLNIKSKEKLIHIWKFKINCMQEQVGIGINSATHSKLSHTNGWYATNTSCFNGCYYTDRKGIQYGKGNWNYKGKPFKTGDKVNMILDLSDRTLSFELNGENQGNFYENIPVEENLNYKMAVLMYYELSSVSLLSYDNVVKT
eukprot:306331_1